MKQSFAWVGFVGVALVIGLLEWKVQAARPETNELIVSQAQRDFVQQQLAQTANLGAPLPDFEQAMAQYVEDEILYREATKLGLEKDDLIVKRRVVQKMRFLLEDMTPIAPPSDEQLDAWLKQNQSRYMTDQTIRFEHHFFSRGKRGDEALFQARIAQQLLLNEQTIQSDPFPLTANESAVSKQRTDKELGLATSQALFNAPIGQWSDAIQSSLGVHLFRVIERDEGRPMTREEAGAALRADLMAAQREEVTRASIAALKATYTIENTP